MRSEIPAEFKWRLEDIYSSDADWEQDFLKLKDLAGKMAEMKGSVNTASRLYEVLQLQDIIGELNEKVFVYSRMRRDEDNRSPIYQNMTDRAGSLSVQVHSAGSYLVPEILQIPQDSLETFFQAEKGLELYRQAINEITRLREHILSASEEQILAQAGELAAAPQNIFSMFNNADIKFPSIKNAAGETEELTKGNYVSFLESRDRRVRQEAFDALYKTYGENQNTLGATLNSSVKKDVFYAKVRSYPSALEASLHGDNVPVSVYDNLITAVRANLGSLHRYAALRKRALGLEELHMYDLYTPIVKDVEMKVSYQEALKRVEEGLAPLGEEYAAVLRKGFTGGWIDVYENQGKTSGAYSWGPFGTHPYVLLNWQDNINNLFTVAHEMGHALHSYYSDHAQPYVYAGYKIFVAEVASTVNESLVMQFLLDRTVDKRERLFLLNHYLEQFRGTVYRQTMFAEFEKLIHEQVENGGALSVEELNRIYHGLNVDYYGPEVVIDQQIDLEWARIPHFYTNFYVYKYATGFSAATALSQGILREGKPAVERYLNFLKSGGSDYPIQLLQRAGVDMTTPQPVEAALKVFEGLVREMEELLE